MAELKICLNTHNFVVTGISPHARVVIENFARKYVQYGPEKVNGRFIQVPKKVYASRVGNGREYRFHINLWRDFNYALAVARLEGPLVEIYTADIPEPERCEFVVFDKWKPQDHQHAPIAYMESDDEPRSKFVDMQTGKGKTFSSLYACSHIGERILSFLKPMYIDKWVADFTKTYDMPSNNIIVVRGAKDLKALLRMAAEGRLLVGVVIISNKTMSQWITLYERYDKETLEMGYACLPGDLCAHLSAGVRLIDEVHLDFHMNFKFDLYTHIKHSISLSATLESDDDFMNRVYEIAYPANKRYKGPAYDKYVRARAILYELQHPNKIRTKDPGSNMYSHHAFEKSVIRNNELASNYLSMIWELVKNSYLRDWVRGERGILFCSSIDMCTLVSSYLKKMMPHIDVRRYVEDDSYEEDLMTGEFIVSTLQSAGTAVDIPMLTTVILTTNVASRQGNIQGLGRLRELKGTGIVPEFLYLVCTSIPKHIEYHERKKVILQDRALEYVCEYVRRLI
jgi:superfamily II DNA or RNA helicase